MRLPEQEQPPSIVPPLPSDTGNEKTPMVIQQAQFMIEHVLESIADPFYALDTEWRFLYVNQVAQQMWGRKDLIGLNIWETFPMGKDTQAYIEMHRAVDEQRPTVFETFSTFLNRWVEVNLYPSSSGLAVYFRDISTRVAAEEALHKSESRLQAMFNQSVIGISLIDERGRFVQVNPGFYKLLGYSPEEIVQLTIESTTNAEDFKNEKPYLDKVLAGELASYTLEKRYIRKDGSEIWVKLTRSRVQDEYRNNVYALAVIEDITERKLAEAEVETAKAALSVQQQRIITIFESIADAFIALDKEFRYTYLNSHGEELTRKLSGKPTNQLIGSSVWDVFPGSYESEIGQAYRSAMQDGEDKQLQAYFQPLDAWFDVRVYPSREGLSIYFVDVSERQRTRNALLEAEERLKLIIDSAKDYAIFALDVERRIASWNAGAERVYGYAEEAILGQSVDILYTPEDREAQVIHEEINHAEQPDTGEDKRWHLRKDGRRFFASGMMRPIRDEAGQLRGYTKVARDTTEQYLAEQQTQILQQLMAELAVKMTSEEMAESIARITWHWVGDAFCSVFLLAEDGQVLKRLATAGNPPPPDDFRALQLASADTVTDAVKRGEIVWMGSQEAYIEQYPHLREVILEIGVQAAISLPLMMQNSPLGGINISFLKPRQLSKAELDMLVAISNLCNQALQRAKLFDAERLAQFRASLRAERLIRLHSVTSKLSQLLNFEQVARVVVDDGVAALGASTGLINMLENENSFAVVYSYADTMDEERPNVWEQFPVDVTIPAGEAVLRREPLWMESVEDLSTRFPDIANTAANYSGAWVILPLMLGERVFGILGFAFAERRQFEEEDRQFMRALAQQCAQAIDRAQLYETEMRARREAEKANTMKMQFLGMISHELRTPLASIKGFTSTLLAEDVVFEPEQQREFLQIIDEESNRLTALVEQLLDLSRLQAGTLRIDPRPQKLQAVISAARIQLDTLTREHQLALELSHDLPLVVVDSERIAQVLVNLVGNGVKFSPPMSLITVKASPVSGHVQVDVSDTGVGIPPDDYETVFEAFRQVERKSPNQRLGAGLGLAICKGVIDAHGGRIWVQDQPNGTTISFTLPTVSQQTG